ncbi:GNAT family N-acetyltransferase [Nocardioides pacificus]
MSAATYRLRSARPEDAALLRELFVQERRVELARSGCSPDQLEQLLDLQLTARDRSYAGRFPEAVSQIVEREGHPVGRILVAEVADAGGVEVRVVDLAVTQAERRRGAATAALRHWLERADHAERPVTLQMSPGNPAGALYAGLGFQPRQTSSTTHLVHLRRPAQRKAPHV